MSEAIGDLFTAAQQGRLREMTRLLDDGVSPHVEDVAGWTAAHHAVRAGQLEALQLLVERKADINTRNRVGCTLVRISVTTEDAVSLLDLAALGANPDIADHDQRTPLHMAVAQRRINAVRDLLEMGASVNLRNTLGETVVHLASSGLDPEILRIIFALGRDVDLEATDVNGNTPIKVARPETLPVFKEYEEGGCSVESGSMIKSALKTT